MKLQFEIKNQKLARTDSSSPVSKSNNYLFAKFEFKTSDWDNLDKIVIFSNYKGAYKEKISSENNNTVLVPSEVLTGRQFRVSVYSCGGMRITTNYIVVELIESDYCQDFTAPSNDGQTDLVCDILSRLDSKIDKVETDDEDILFYAEDELVYTLPIKSIVLNVLKEVQLVHDVYLQEDDLYVDYFEESMIN